MTYFSALPGLMKLFLHGGTRILPPGKFFPQNAKRSGFEPHRDAANEKVNGHRGVGHYLVNPPEKVTVEPS